MRQPALEKWQNRPSSHTPSMKQHARVRKPNPTQDNTSDLRKAAERTSCFALAVQTTNGSNHSATNLSEFVSTLDKTPASCPKQLLVVATTPSINNTMAGPVSQLAQQLTAGLPTQRDKAVAIHDWVRDNVQFGFNAW
jgi:transglutaminase-like putative cysteine protease